MTKPQCDVTLLITGNDPELFTWFVEDSLAEKEGRGGFVFQTGEHRVRFFCGSALPDDVPVDELDGCFCLVRFVDHPGMQALSRQLNPLSERLQIPVHFLLYRKANEQDFKMSCSFCGQKLWVRDADLDKRGRCPSCKKGFNLPGQEDQVVRLLGLRQDALIDRLSHGDASSLAAAVGLFLKRREEREALPTLKEVFRENADTMVVRVD
jgi:hypothetical protein